MAWRTRTAVEAANTETLQSAGTNTGGVGIGYLISDVVRISGMDDIAGLTDTYVLQMSYNEALLGIHEAGGVNHGNIFIVWNNGGNWVNAVEGNDNGTGLGNYVGGLAAITNVLGDYGINPGTNTVWAVLNHQGDFAVIPEPSTLVLGGLALLGFAGVGLRRRRMAKKCN